LENNVYYNPAAYNLTLIGTVNLSEPDYSFDMLAVWKGDDGYYLGTDSGCSCPTPFESYNGAEDLTGPLTSEQTKEEAESNWRGYDPESFRAFMEEII
jgi:hypothetical protein